MRPGLQGEAVRFYEGKGEGSSLNLNFFKMVAEIKIYYVERPVS